MWFVVYLSIVRFLNTQRPCSGLLLPQLLELLQRLGKGPAVALGFQDEELKEPFLGTRSY